MGLDPGKLNQISTKIIESCLPKGQHLVPLVTRYWSRSIKYMYIPYWVEISLFLDFANCVFCILEKILIKDANKISHELKLTK